MKFIAVRWRFCCSKTIVSSIPASALSSRVVRNDASAKTPGTRTVASPVVRKDALPVASWDALPVTRRDVSPVVTTDASPVAR